MKNETKTTTVKEAIDHLTYISFKTNRNLSPHTSLKSWAKIYGEKQVQVMERKLEDEWLCELYDEMADRNPQWNSEA